MIKNKQLYMKNSIKLLKNYTKCIESEEFMNEEEKKAIELLENIKDNSWTTKYIMSSDSKNAEILLNLIKKLQKNNEKLKEKLLDTLERAKSN